MKTQLNMEVEKAPDPNLGKGPGARALHEGTSPSPHDISRSSETPRGWWPREAGIDNLAAYAKPKPHHQAADHDAGGELGGELERGSWGRRRHVRRLSDHFGQDRRPAQCPFESPLDRLDSRSKRVRRYPEAPRAAPGGRPGPRPIGRRGSSRPPSRAASTSSRGPTQDRLAAPSRRGDRRSGRPADPRGDSPDYSAELRCDRFGQTPCGAPTAASAADPSEDREPGRPPQYRWYKSSGAHPPAQSSMRPFKGPSPRPWCRD